MLARPPEVGGGRQRTVERSSLMRSSVLSLSGGLRNKVIVTPGIGEVRGRVYDVYGTRRVVVPPYGIMNPWIRLSILERKENTGQVRIGLAT
ncbi:hypothetical protein EVAR_52688_1 [Eumeta japonica]|uniref:Uncharacterized protein n=1 Tax=Eumeta variegata TaxID=151549 RepID=A0A4C1Y0I8_EUMVA|nr:hypothetical protein EVAR_52688_1 [Eumeta japonica]